MNDERPTWSTVRKQTGRVRDVAENVRMEPNLRMPAIARETALLNALVGEVGSADTLRAAEIVAAALDRNAAATAAGEAQSVELTKAIARWTKWAAVAGIGSAVAAAFIALLGAIEVAKLLGLL